MNKLVIYFLKLILLIELGIFKEYTVKLDNFTVSLQNYYLKK